MAKDKVKYVPYEDNGRDGIDSWTSNGHGLFFEDKDDKEDENKAFREIVKGDDLSSLKKE